MSDNHPIFLLGNDDGVHAPGLKVLKEHLRDLGRVVVAAPHLERSGASSAITIALPILVQQVEEDVYGIEGTPVDAMMLALQKLLPSPPTWVISGINRGGNLGTDTIYSGTVGAAIEGCLLGIPSMAVSVEGSEPLQYSTAAKVVEYLIGIPQIKELAKGSVVNVNVPNIPWSDLKGVVAASLGRRIYHGMVDERQDPRGKPYFWLGPGAKGHEPIAGSDCVEIKAGFATVTMLKPDLNDPEKTEQLRDILKTGS
jgi:5'-nucleotidase